MVIKMLLIMTLLVLAVINDLYNYKVRNEITFGFVIAGIIFNYMFYGRNFFVSTFLGLALPLIVLLPLYSTSMMGAGDIKLFSAIGVFIGHKLVLSSIAYSFILGAIIALIIMLVRGNALQRFGYFFSYIKCCFMAMTIMPYADFNDKYDGTKMHFTIPIALGTLLVLVLDSAANYGGIL